MLIFLTADMACVCNVILMLAKVSSFEIMASQCEGERERDLKEDWGLQGGEKEGEQGD